MVECFLIGYRVIIMMNRPVDGTFCPDLRFAVKVPLRKVEFPPRYYCSRHSRPFSALNLR